MADEKTNFIKTLTEVFIGTLNPAELLIDLALAIATGAITAHLSDKRALEKSKKTGYTEEKKIWGRYANSTSNIGDVIPVLYGRMNIVPTQLIQKVNTTLPGTNADVLLAVNGTAIVNMPRLSAYNSIGHNHLFGHQIRRAGAQAGRVTRLTGGYSTTGTNAPTYFDVSSVTSETLTGLHSCNRIGSGSNSTPQGRISSGLFNQNSFSVTNDHSAGLANPSPLAQDAAILLRSGFDVNNSYAPKIPNDLTGNYVETFTIESFSTTECNSDVRWQSRCHTWWSGLRSFVNDTPGGFSSRLFDSSFNVVNFGSSGTSFSNITRFPFRAATIGRTSRVYNISGTQIQPTANNPANTVVPRSISRSGTFSAFSPYTTPIAANNIENRQLFTADEHGELNANEGLYIVCSGRIVNEPYHATNQPNGYIIYNGEKQVKRAEEPQITNNRQDLYDSQRKIVINNRTRRSNTPLKSFSVNLRGDKNQILPAVPIYGSLPEDQVDTLTAYELDNSMPEPDWSTRTSIAGVQSFSADKDRIGRRVSFSEATIFDSQDLIDQYSDRFILHNSDGAVHKLVLRLGFPDGLEVIDDDGSIISAGAYNPYDSARKGVASLSSNFSGYFELHAIRGGNNVDYSNVVVTNGRRLYTKFCLLFREAYAVNSDEYNDPSTWTKRFVTFKGTADKEFSLSILYEFSNSEISALTNRDIEVRILRTESYIQNFFASGLPYEMYDSTSNFQTDLTSAELASRQSTIDTINGEIVNAIEAPYYERTSNQKVEIQNLSYYTTGSRITNDMLEGSFSDSDKTYMYHQIISRKRTTNDFKDLNITCTRLLPTYDVHTGWTDQGNNWTLTATRNPIWAVADMYRNTTYGAGLKLDRYIDGAVWSQLAAQMTNEGRFYDDLVSFKQAINMAVARAMLPLRGITFKNYSDLLIVPDRVREDSSLKRMFTHANIIEDSFFLTFRARDKRNARVLLAHYYDASARHQQKSVFVDHDGEVQDLIYNEFHQITESRFYGITDKQRVINEAKHTIRTNIYQVTTLSFVTGSDGLTLNLGDFIMVAHKFWKPCESAYIRLSNSDDYENLDASHAINIRILLSEPVRLEASKNYNFYYSDENGKPSKAYPITNQFVNTTTDVSSVTDATIATDIPLDYYNVIQITVPAVTEHMTDEQNKLARDAEVTLIQNDIVAKDNQDLPIFLIVEETNTSETNELHKDNFFRAIVTNVLPKSNFSVNVQCVAYDSRVYN